MRSRLWGMILMLALGAVAAGVEGEAPPAEAGAAGGEVFEETIPPRDDLFEPAEPGRAPGEPAPASPGPGDAGEDSWLRELNKALDAYERGEGGPGGAGDEGTLASGLAKRFASTVVGLCVVLAAILLLARAARRFGARHPTLAGAALGKEIGRVYLNRRLCLHFVRVGDRVLVVGATPTTASRIAELDAAELEAQAGEEASGGNQGGGFMTQLRAATRRIGGGAEPEAGAAPAEAEEPSGNASPEDDEIAALRDGIQRLQQQIQESSSGEMEE
ncbi:MAG: flagellar biosynthetic protein FliO [Candidatus Hydrogenedentes bacterium]|nr:flagellar biosynthetic protein FliO [Candidatus Hydrogenedentota bacterium]